MSGHCARSSSSAIYIKRLHFVSASLEINKALTAIHPFIEFYHGQTFSDRLQISASPAEGISLCHDVLERCSRWSPVNTSVNGGDTRLKLSILPQCLPAIYAGLTSGLPGLSGWNHKCSCNPTKRPSARCTVHGAF